MFVYDSRSDGADVQLSAGANGKKIPAHKTVLSSASEYFKLMFSGSFKESIESTVVIADIESETLEAIIEFIYCGSVKISNHDEATELLKTAHLMELPQLLKFSEDYLVENMTEDTCFEIWSLAKLYNRDNLLNQAKDLMANELKSFSQREEFKELDKDLLVELITEKQESTFEDNIAVGILSWLDFDKSRLIYYKEYLQLLKIECIEREIEHCSKINRKIIRNIVSVGDKLIVLTREGLYEYIEDKEELKKELEKLVLEDDIAEPVLTWIYVDKKRFMHFQELLQLIKFESIDCDAIIQKLLGNCTTKEEYGIMFNALKKRNCLIKSIANNSKPQTLIACVTNYSEYLLFEYNFTTKIVTKKSQTKFYADILGLWNEMILFKNNNELICYNTTSKTYVSSLIGNDYDMNPRASAKIGDIIYFLFKKQLHKWNLVNNSMENIVPPEQLNCYKFEAMCELNGEIKIFAYLKRKRRCIEILTYNPLNNFWSMISAVSNIVHDDFKWFSILVAHKNCLCYFTKNKLHMFDLSDRKWSYIEHNQKIQRNNIINIVSIGDKLIVLIWKELYEYIEDEGKLKTIYCEEEGFGNIRAIFCN